MRRLRMLAIPAVLMLLAVGCTSEEGTDGDGGGANQEENTGTVNVLNAMEPEEADAVQALWDDTYPGPRLHGRLRGLGRLRGAVRRSGPRAARSTSILLPQLGTIAGNYVPRRRRLARGHGLRHRRAERAARASRSSRSVRSTGEHYGIPIEHQPEEHGLVPEGRLRRCRLHGADDVGRADRPRDQIVADGGTPWCVGFESRRRDRVGRRPTGWKTSCSGRPGRTSTTSGSSTRSRSTTRPSRPPAEMFGDVMFGDGYVLGGADQTPAIAFGDAPTADVRRPARLLAPPAGELHQRLLPRGHGGRRGLRLVPVPPIDQEGTLYGGEMAVTFRNRPGGRGLPEPVHRRRLPVRDGRRDGVLADLPVRQRRGRTAT